jgi:hypothetical protein
MASARGAFARLTRAHRACLAFRVSARARSSRATDYEDCLRLAGATAPTHLRELIDVLRAQGGVPIDPRDRDGVHPLVLPLARFQEDETSTSSSGSLPTSRNSTVGLLLLPTNIRNGTDLVVVRFGPGGVRFLAPSASLHVHAALVEEEHSFYLNSLKHGKDPARGGDTYRPVMHAAGVLGLPNNSKCPPGTFARMPKESPKKRKEVFTQSAFGCVFPHAVDLLIQHHEVLKKDHLSALVTSEWYTRQRAFAGWGMPHLVNAKLLKKHGRGGEARDAARVALASAPWWTLGAESGLPMALAAMAGLRDTLLRDEWGAVQFRDLLDTGGEAHRAAAAAMGVGDDEGEKAGDKNQFWTNAFEKAATARMDVVSLQAPSDLAKGGGEHTWNSVRHEVSALYEEGGLPGYAEFVSGK